MNPLRTLLLALILVPASIVQAQKSATIGQPPRPPAPRPPAPQNASNQSSVCGLISQADAESVVGFPLRAMPPLDQSSCNFLGSRPGLMSVIRIQVIVEVRYSATPNPGAVNQRRQLFNDSVRAGVLTEFKDVADDALWDWTNDYNGTGRLVAYKGGTTELFITIEGLPENTALPAAKKLAARALGPKTGFVYTAAAPPEKTCDPNDSHNIISGCWTAKEALTEKKRFGGLGFLRVDSEQEQPAELGGPAIVELVKARADFWATSRNSDRHGEAVVRLRRALSAVDFTYLWTHFYSLNFGLPPGGAEQQRQNFYQLLLGAPPEEYVIHESARKQFDAWISAVYNRLNGGFGDILNIWSRLPQALDESEVIYERYRAARDTAELQGPAAAAEGPPKYRLMSWDELNRIPKLGPGGGRPSQMPQYFAMRGTVSRVEVRPTPSGINETGPWVNVYFRESAEQATGGFGTSYGAFNVCTWGTDILERMFGPDFRTRMIGQVLEVQGEYGRGCMGWKGSIRIELAHQVRKVAAR